MKFPSLEIPSHQHPVDWLIALDPAYAGTPLSNWDERYNDPFLTDFAKFVAKWADAYDSLADVVVLGAQWTCRQKSERFYSLKKLDRRSSFMGGLPWTCEKYPWPQKNGKWLSPLIQLNLSDLPLDHIADFPPILLQVWGYQLDQPEVREIPLSAIADQIPSHVIKPWQDEHVAYEYEVDRFDWGQPAPTDLSLYETLGQCVGEYVSIGGDWKFCLGNELENNIDWSDIISDWNDDPTMADILDAWQGDVGRLFELLSSAPQMRNMPDHLKGGGRFGGQMQARQTSYEEWLPDRNLLTPPDSGLSILAGGYLNILWLEDDGKIGFYAFTDR